MVLPHLRREMFHGRISFEEGGLRRPPAEALQARPSMAQQQPLQAATGTVASPIVRPLHTQTPQQQQQQQQQPQPQLIQGSQTATPVRPGNAVQIHASPMAQHYVSGQRPITPGVAGKFLFLLFMAVEKHSDFFKITFTRRLYLIAIDCILVNY